MEVHNNDLGGADADDFVNQIRNSGDLDKNTNITFLRMSAIDVMTTKMDKEQKEKYRDTINKMTFFT